MVQPVICYTWNPYDCVRRMDEILAVKPAIVGIANPQNPEGNWAGRWATSWNDASSGTEWEGEAGFIKWIDHLQGLGMKVVGYSGEEPTSYEWWKTKEEYLSHRGNIMNKWGMNGFHKDAAFMTAPFPYTEENCIDWRKAVGADGIIIVSQYFPQVARAISNEFAWDQPWRWEYIDYFNIESAWQYLIYATEGKVLYFPKIGLTRAKRFFEEWRTYAPNLKGISAGGPWNERHPDRRDSLINAGYTYDLDVIRDMEKRAFDLGLSLVYSTDRPYSMPTKYRLEEVYPPPKLPILPVAVGVGTYLLTKSVGYAAGTAVLAAILTRGRG